MATAAITHKRGDTFDRLLLIPADFADGYWVGWVVTSQARTPRGKLIADLTPTWAAPAGDTRILRLFNTSTQLWPIGAQEIDVQFKRTSDATIRSTVTMALNVVHDVTQP